MAFWFRLRLALKFQNRFVFASCQRHPKLKSCEWVLKKFAQNVSKLPKFFDVFDSFLEPTRCVLSASGTERERQTERDGPSQFFFLVLKKTRPSAGTNKNNIWKARSTKGYILSASKHEHNFSYFLWSLLVRNRQFSFGRLKELVACWNWRKSEKTYPIRAII